MRNFWLANFLVFSLIYSNVSAAEDDESDAGKLHQPIVHVKNGTLQGFRTKLVLAKPGKFNSADIFLGIPYARPPINELRLEVNILLA